MHYYYINFYELLYEFLSFVELEEPNDLKHCAAGIGREIMRSAIPQYMSHPS